MTTARAVIEAAHKLVQAGIDGAVIELCLRDFARFVLDLRLDAHTGPRGHSDGRWHVVLPLLPARFDAPADPTTYSAQRVFVTHEMLNNGVDISGVVVRCR